MKGWRKSKQLYRIWGNETELSSRDSWSLVSSRARNFNTNYLPKFCDQWKSMPHNCELTWIVEELSLAGNFLHFLLSTGLGPDLVYCRLWQILASCPCPRFLNSGSISLAYIYFNKPPCWYWSLAKFGILDPIPLLGKIEAGGEEDDRGWDGWMASLTQWTRVWVDSRSWWCTGKPGMLRFMGSQRVRHDWVTELNWSYTSRFPFSISQGLFFLCAFYSSCS